MLFIEGRLDVHHAWHVDLLFRHGRHHGRRVPYGRESVGFPVSVDCWLRLATLVRAASAPDRDQRRHAIHLYLFSRDFGTTLADVTCHPELHEPTTDHRATLRSRYRWRSPVCSGGDPIATVHAATFAR